MRALVEALGASSSSSEQQQLLTVDSSGGSGGGEGAWLLGEVGASPEEREALLEAFASVRCVVVWGKGGESAAVARTVPLLVLGPS
jgi:hypothetical protein